MCKAQQQEIDALTNLEGATEKELDLARLRLIDLGVDVALRKHVLPKDDDLPIAFNPSTGMISANGLTLQLDVEELIYTGDLLLHVITEGRKCGHRIKQRFGGFDAEYRKPKYCPSCKAERRRIKAEKVWEEYKQIWPEAATAGDATDDNHAWGDILPEYITESVTLVNNAEQPTIPNSGTFQWYTIPPDETTATEAQ